ncbi:MAG: glycosyltransferase family 39 protein [Fimbriimonadaceae bacterium]|nr:glycosyltransferase family 39 protein [Fimbriimonadaceae bacterium]
MQRKHFEPAFLRTALVLAVLPFLGWWMYPLFDLDEGFYAAIVGEMQRRGDWLTPFYNGSAWFEKPILLYWAAGPLNSIWQSEFMLRAPSVAATLGTAWILYRWIGSTHGQAAGVITGLAYATSLVPVLMGRLMTPDALFTMCMVGAFASFVESMQMRPKRRVISGGWLGLAVLAKGPVALILFGMVVVVSYWRESTLRHRFKGGWLLFTITCLSVIAIWYVPCYLANRDEFVQKFLIEQNLQRFLGGDSAHRTAWYLTPIYYPLIMLLGMFPWSYYALRSYRIVGLDATTRFAVRWCVLVLVFFSISQSKLPHYILPALPPVAVLAARYLQMVKEAASEPHRVLRPAVAASVLILLITQSGLMFWADVSGQSEARSKALSLKRDAGSDPIVAYQLTRQPAQNLPTAPRPWWKPKVNETSLPSIVYYLDRNIVISEDLQSVSSADRFWIFTRENRRWEADPLMQTATISDSIRPGDQYRVIKVERAASN